MARTRTCHLCGASVKQNVAAHDCPHGAACRYMIGENGMPADWKSPDCAACRGAEANPLVAVPRMGLTDKALDELDD